MAGHFKFLPSVDDNHYRSCLFTTAVTDADIGKPVKLSATDEYTICSDGDLVDGFINSVESQTMGGKVFGTVMDDGVQSVQLSGAVSIGACICAAAPATLGTAETGKLGKVKTHTKGATDPMSWRVISGTGLDGDLTAVIERL